MGAYTTSFDAEVGRSLALAHQLGHLAELSPTLYTTDASGSVIQETHLDPVIHEARAMQLRIFPVIQNLDAGTWDRTLIAAIVTDDARRSHHAQEIINVVVRNNWNGIDLDYEALEPADWPGYLQFVRQLATGLHRVGKQLTVAVPAKTSDSDDDPAAQGADYGQLASVADEVRVMAYDHSWETSPPGPVAPIDWVRQVLQYAQRHIPPHKLMLGIAAYGYDWAGGHGTPLAAAAAATLASRQHASVHWDAASAAAWFRYMSAGQQHIVWFENADAMNAKIHLATQAGIRGIIIWQLGGADPTFWTNSAPG